MSEKNKTKLICLSGTILGLLIFLGGFLTKTYSIWAYDILITAGAMVFVLSNCYYLANKTMLAKTEN